MAPQMRRSLVIGAAVSAAALYFSLRHVPFDTLGAYLGTVDWRFLGLSLGVTGIFLLAKVVRWQIILGARYRVRFAQAYHPMMIGFMLNCVLPGRVGELARPAILRRRGQVPFTTGLATVAVERLMDMLTLLGLLAWVLATLDFDPHSTTVFAGYRLNTETVLDAGRVTLLLAVVLMAGVLLFTRQRFRRGISRLLRAMPRIVPASRPAARDWVERRLSRPLDTMLDHMAAGLALVHQPLRLGVCAGLSVGIWLLASLSFHLLSLGFPGIDLGLRHMAAMLVIISFCIALPSVPGWWGLWEAGGVFALSLFGIAAEPAAGFTLVNHAMQVFPVLLLGLISVLATGIGFKTCTRADGAFENGAG